MEPYRAFIADKLPPSQLGKGFLAQSFSTGFGITLANLSLWVFQQLIDGATDAGIPYWVVGSFMLGAVCSIGSVLVSILTTPEIPPTPEELAALRAKKGGFVAAIREIWEAIVEMPGELRKLALVYLFQWYALVCYWQFVSLSIAESVYGVTSAEDPRYGDAVSWTGLINGWYNIVTFCVAFFLVALARQRGAKWVHIVCLLCAAVGLVIFANLDNRYLLFIPIIGLGIAWASIMGVPYIMAVRMIPSTRYGVYMGIINMMIVIPMLIQTVTLGWIYANVLGDDPTNAIMFAGILLAVAAAAVAAVAQEQGATIPAALLIDGDPAGALLSTAKERAADLIVVGAFRDTSIAERLLGTVATEVVRRAECEVLVVRPRQEAADLSPPDEGVLST